MKRLENTLTRIDEPPQSPLNQYGGTRLYAAADGSRLTVLPTATFPPSHFIESNWPAKERETNVGNFRNVRYVTHLIDGTRTELFAKSPERIFNRDFDVVKTRDRERIWWGGRRSGERPILVEDPVVEEQTDWEAATLIELLRLGINAEVPQAVITHLNGTKELITRAVEPPREQATTSRAVGMTPEQISTLVSACKATPVDFGAHNTLRDANNELVIIDVNRWEWRPTTDEYRRRLVEVTQNAIQRAAS